MLIFKKNYINQDVLLEKGEGKILTRIQEGFSQSRMMEILEAGYAHLFENAAEFIEKPSPKNIKKATFRVIKDSDGKLTEALRKQSALIEKAYSFSFQELKYLGADGIKKEFSNRKDLDALVKRINSDVKDASISLKLKTPATLKEIERLLEEI